jgi:protein-tyrosine-phosphatase
LFLCTGNSARSQIAEALLERMSAGTIEARSAGSHPKPLHPNAVRVLRRRGIDISANRTKHVDELTAERFDTLITLCDRKREVCPAYPSRPELVHWSVPDPALGAPSNRASYAAFVRTAAELETRIGYRFDLIAETTTRRTSPHAER